MLDLNQGVTKRYTPKGVAVCMYKKDPGVFFDDQGNELEVAFARDAGYDVKELLGQREMRRRMEEAQARIEQEVRQEMEGQKATLRQKALYRRIPQGVDEDGVKRFDVENQESGERMSETPLTQEEADALIARLEGGQDGG